MTSVCKKWRGGSGLASETILDVRYGQSCIAFDSHEFILKPLFFPENEVEGREADYCLLGGLHDVPITCLTCERRFNAPSTAKDEFLKHLLEEHKIVIHKVHQVCSLSRSVML